MKNKLLPVSLASLLLAIGVAAGYFAKPTPAGGISPGLRALMTERGCVSLGMPQDPEVAKYLGEGFACGSTLVVVPK